MSFPKLNNASAAIKSAVNRRIISKSNPTINLSILESQLLRCRTPRQFDEILSQMVLTGYLKDAYAASRLLKFSTEASFIPVEYSQTIFTRLESSNGFTWNIMMRAFVQRKNCPQEAILLYKSMLNENLGTDNYTFPILIQAASLRVSGFEGKQMHGHVLKLGYDSDIYVRNTMINMYAVCGNMGDGRRVFDESRELDSVSWNSILAGYVQIGDVEEAKRVFDRMPERNTIASNSMIVLFGKTSRVVDALNLFNQMENKDMVSWSALISCYEQNVMYDEALGAFKRMCAGGIALDEVVLVSVLSACSHLSAREMGDSVHGLAVKLGIESYVNLRNALIFMYSKCEEVMEAQKLFDVGHHNLDLISWNSMISAYVRSGFLERAEALFNSMLDKDLVSWSTMISGYAQHDHFSKTLELFQEMQLSGVRPDQAILVSVISACTHLGALDQGRWVHAYISKNDLKVNVILGTTLVDMYMKCGCVESAMDVFSKIEERGVSTWNAVILGLAINGSTQRSLEFFSEMKNSSVNPNEITFMAVLGACRHMGLVDEGRSHFDSMVREYSVEPNVKHYGCMVDLLGRAGELREAEELIQKMPMAPDVSTWGALLGACRKHGNVELGERVGRKLIELQPDHDGFHVLLSNMYASRGHWDDVIEIRGMMTENRVVKTPGCSMIEANGVVHEFLAGDKTHPQIDEIENKLEEVTKRLKMEGYMPDTNEVFLEIDDEEKETSLFRHSEKLAVAFGLLHIASPAPIRIMKNLRICNDCHMGFKLTSKAYDREIVVRDKHRFHHFKHGTCSCLDFW